MAKAPEYSIKEVSDCLHLIEVKLPNTTNGKFKVLHISDVHFDSKHCKRELLFKHLDQAVKEGAFICIYGDWFDLMGAKRDPRSVTGDIRPEYTKADYLDQVIEDAHQQLKPYADHIVFMSAGNHETSIVKHKETDPLRRLVHLLNQDTEHKIQQAGYAGYIVWRMLRGKKSSVWTQHYHHGYGGNARRSKGMLNVDIDMKQASSADLIVRGHIHQKWFKTENIERVNHKPNVMRIERNKVVYLQMGSYKDDVTDVPYGWAKQKHFDTPEGGGYLTTFIVQDKKTNKKAKTLKDIRVQDWNDFTIFD